VEFGVGCWERIGQRTLYGAKCCKCASGRYREGNEFSGWEQECFVGVDGESGCRGGGNAGDGFGFGWGDGAVYGGGDGDCEYGGDMEFEPGGGFGFGVWAVYGAGDGVGGDGCYGDGD